MRKPVHLELAELVNEIVAKQGTQIRQREDYMAQCQFSIAFDLQHKTNIHPVNRGESSHGNYHSTRFHLAKAKLSSIISRLLHKYIFAAMAHREAMVSS